ncbi:MAG: hypothetical protein H0V07_07855, partial [Propionibacteriales bacterium]|nr:hypothetical protein [Propionibacteriales bacterium]
VNYTGCDSLFSTAADSTTVYIGGHERWADNPFGCDRAGAGAVSAPGMAGLDPGSGRAFTSSSDPTVGKYSHGRGLGADDMLVTTAGLWIASDNAFGSDICGENPDGTAARGHAGICFLPYPPG